MPDAPDTRRPYGAAHRAIEVAAIAAAGTLSLYLLARLTTAGSPARFWIIGAAMIAGYVAADLVSGVVHRIFDTWGSESTPLLGQSFIRPFREHHSDPLSITRHDFVETNGNSALATLPVLAGACFVPTDSRIGLAVAAFLLFTSLGVLATNQIHKWAHVERPSRLVRLLQRWNLILSTEQHRRHHAAPYATHYCITTGWLNPLLDAAGTSRRRTVSASVSRTSPHS